MSLEIITQRATTPSQFSLWLSCLRGLDEKLFFPYRYRRLTEILSPHLRGMENALDVGSSCGRLARQLMDKTGCAGDNEFDCVMMVDMLHHTNQIVQVLSEATRVSRKYLLIKDHYWDHCFDWAALSLYDYIGNAPYGVSLPLNYLRFEEWMAMFKRLNLCIVSSETFKYHAGDPCKHVLFKLQKIAGLI